MKRHLKIKKIELQNLREIKVKGELVRSSLQWLNEEGKDRPDIFVVWRTGTILTKKCVTDVGRICVIT